MTKRVRDQLKASQYIREAAQRHGVEPAAVHGRNRHKRVCHARFEVMRRLRADGLSASEIGRALNRDHTTILDGLARVAPGLWFG